MAKTPSPPRPSRVPILSHLLPWEEEKFGVYKDHGLLLARFYRENANLKAQLRAFNSQVDTVLTELQAKRPRPEPKNTVRAELEVAKTQLSLCEKEHSALDARIRQLSNPSYVVNLEEQVQAMESQLHSLELSLKRQEKNKLLRDRVLESVLETGETPDMVKDLAYTITEVSVYKALAQAVEREVQEQTPHLQKLAVRDRELTEEINRLSREVGSAPAPASVDLVDLKNRLVQAKADLASREKAAKYSQLKLQGRVKQLRLELAEMTHTHKDMLELLEVKTMTSRRAAQEIRSLSPLLFPTRRLHTESVFLTENSL